MQYYSVALDKRLFGATVHAGVRLLIEYGLGGFHHVRF